MCAFASVGVNDDLAAGKTGVAMRSADDEFAGRVDIQFEVLVEQLAQAARERTAYARDKEAVDVGADTLKGFLVGIFDVVVVLCPLPPPRC